MQTANIMLALGGDHGNTVPKYAVTAGEVAVLAAIHGTDAVFDVSPLGEIVRSNRDELVRLKEIYGKAKDESNKSIVDLMFPGVAARVFESIAELGLAPEQFAASGRVAATVKMPEADEVPEEFAADEEYAEEAEEEDEIEPMSVAEVKAAAKAAKSAKAAKKEELFG